MIKPKKLKKGDTIGLIAPSSDANKKRVDKSIEYLKSLGFKVKIGDSCYSKYGYLAGKDDLRVKDIHNMFSDKEVDGIICIRGGYGVSRILDKIDYDIIKNNPKVFVGYSDITALHIAIHNECNLITFHGPMTVSNMEDGLDDFSLESFRNTLMNNDIIGRVNNPKGEKITTLVKGKTQGKIIGGNLALISATIGTPYEIDIKDKILFIEEIGEEPFRIDRMIMQLKLSGKLDEVKGIVLGDFNKCEPEDPNDHNLMKVIEDLLVSLNKPMIFNIKSGHCSPIITLPLGAEVELNADEGELIIKESVTIDG